MGRKRNDTNYPITASCAGRELHCSRRPSRPRPPPPHMLRTHWPHASPALMAEVVWPVCALRRGKGTQEHCGWPLWKTPAHKGAKPLYLTPEGSQIPVLWPFEVREHMARMRGTQVSPALSEVPWCLPLPASNPTVSSKDWKQPRSKQVIKEITDSWRPWGLQAQRLSPCSQDRQ